QITVLPAAPDGVAATYGTNSQAVQITWEASAGATGYGVWRSLSSDGTAATQINTADITGLAYNDTTAAAGTVYWYWVWAHDGSGSGTFSSAVQERPANDDFAARATLSGTSVTLTGMNLNATKESGEPDHAGRVGGTSVWWTWTAPFSGDVTIDTIGSNFNTLLAVYTGNSVSALTAVPNGADDDIPGGQPGGPSKVTFGVTGGTVYQIAVDGYQGATGNFTLNLNLLPSAPGGVAATYGTNSGEVRVTWNASAGASGYDVWRDSSSTFSTATSLATGIQGLSFDDTTAVAGIPYWYKVNACDNNGSGTLSSAVPDRPANDNFAARATLSGTSITLTGMNLNATQESGEPDHAGQAGGSSVWWTWTAPFSGSATIDTLGSNFNTLLAVYTGSNVRTLAGVAGGADDDVAGRSDGTSKVTFTANGGTVYQIAVDGYNGATGTIALSLQLIPLGPDGVAATYGTGSGGVRLTWNASAGASSYDVWRDSISDNGNSKIQIAADVQGPNFDDATAVAGVPYWYWIRARDANGSGGFSAGVQLTGSITATVFNDANGDGIRQSTEKPLANITVYIDANNNGSFDAGERTARTNKTGVYLFSNVPIGSYVVRPVLPAGYRPATNLNTPLPTLLPGQALGRNIGLTTNALVSGTVFLDTNKNGKMDTTEVGLARYRVFIDNDNDGVWDANETSVLTNATGAFSFPTLAAGSYVLRVVPAKGYKVATPATKLYSLSLKAGQTVSARNFAVVKA
ncbi:MAG: SdrD B-like domain-containing protein, partial [Tepidisphaeraceae bacterium]